MGAWTGADILVGDGSAGQIPGADVAAEKVKREATLKSLGIKTLAPYGSALMTGNVVSKIYGTGKGNWRDGPRQVAHRNGLTRYWGRLCKDSHDSPRYVSTGQCCECMALRGKADWAANRKAKSAAG